MKRAITISAIFMAALAFSAHPAAAQGPQALVIGEAKPTMLIRGTPVPLRLLRELTTKGKKLKVGDRFEIETVGSLKLGTATIVPAGTRVVGEIKGA